MDILLITHKGKHMNIIEKFHIYNLSRRKSYGNHIVINNPIFGIIITQNLKKKSHKPKTF